MGRAGAESGPIRFVVHHIMSALLVGPHGSEFSRLWDLFDESSIMHLGNRMSAFPQFRLFRSNGRQPAEAQRGRDILHGCKEWLKLNAECADEAEVKRISRDSKQWRMWCNWWWGLKKISPHTNNTARLPYRVMFSSFQRQTCQSVHVNTTTKGVNDPESRFMKRNPQNLYRERNSAVDDE
jgi:hypothetical protein